MFCSKCGVSNQDDARFCKVCGAKLMQEKNVTEALKEKVDIKKVKDSFEKKTSSQKKRFIAAAAIIITLVVIFVAVLSAGSGPKRVVEDFFDAIYEGDIEGVLDAFPEDLIDRVIYEDFWDEEEFMEELKDIVGEVRYEMMGYGAKIRVSEVRDLTTGESYELNEYYREYYGFIAISDAKKVTVTAVFPHEYSYMNDSMNWLELDVIKVDGKWYIGNSMADIF